MAGRPLRPATRRRLGRPSPHQQADRPRAHPQPQKLSTTHHAADSAYPVLAPVSEGYPKVRGRLLTCYSPVRRSSTPKGLSARLACVKHAASVRPEPGSNSPLRSHDPGNRSQNLENHQPSKRHGLGRPCFIASKKSSTRIVQDRTEVLPYLALTFSTLLSSQETGRIKLLTLAGFPRCDVFNLADPAGLSNSKPFHIHHEQKGTQ